MSIRQHRKGMISPCCIEGTKHFSRSCDFLPLSNHRSIFKHGGRDQSFCCLLTWDVCVKKSISHTLTELHSYFQSFHTLILIKCIAVLSVTVCTGVLFSFWKVMTMLCVFRTGTSQFRIKWMSNLKIWNLLLSIVHIVFSNY